MLFLGLDGLQDQFIRFRHLPGRFFAIWLSGFWLAVSNAWSKSAVGVAAPISKSRSGARSRNNWLGGRFRSGTGVVPVRTETYRRDTRATTRFMGRDIRRQQVDSSLQGKSGFFARPSHGRLLARLEKSAHCGANKQDASSEFVVRQGEFVWSRARQKLRFGDLNRSAGGFRSRNGRVPITEQACSNRGIGGGQF